MIHWQFFERVYFVQVITWNDLALDVLCDVGLDTKRNYVISYRFLSCLNLQTTHHYAVFMICSIHIHIFFKNDFYWPIALYCQKTNWNINVWSLKLYFSFKITKWLKRFYISLGNTIKIHKFKWYIIIITTQKELLFRFTTSKLY